MGIPSKKEKAGEVTLSAVEAFQRAALSFLPGGPFITEFLDFRSNLKQKRILDFSESVKIALEEMIGEEIDPSNFTTEEFVDVFDAVIAKVQNTRSKVKLECLKNIIVNQSINSSANDILTHKIIQTVDELNEVQLLILIVIGRHTFYPTIYDIHQNFDTDMVYIRLNPADELPGGIKQEQVIESTIFLHFLDELVSKGLLFEREVDGRATIPLREMGEAYNSYMNSKLRLSNSRIVYDRSQYSDLLCSFIMLS